MGPRRVENRAWSKHFTVYLLTFLLLNCVDVFPILKIRFGTPLVIQWLGIHLPKGHTCDP